MPSFSVNESLFVIDMDDTSESFLSIGEKLADGITIGVDRDRGEEFAFYVSEDGKYDILAAAPNLAERWVRENYLQKRMLQPHFTDEGDIDCYLLICPSSHVLMRLTEVRVHKSPYYAHMVAAAIYRSRLIDQNINLRDGILCELYGVVLPTYTKTPLVADYALFYNTLRGQYDSEDLRTPNDFVRNNEFAGINSMSFNILMQQAKMKADTIEPYFQVGEEVDEFVQLKHKCVISGPLVLTEKYQIFATDIDVVLLALSNEWAQELIEHNLLMQMDLKPVQIGREMIKVIALERSYALEPLNDRHFGINMSNAFELSLAISRTRRKLEHAKLDNALYVQALGLILPIDFTSGKKSDDVDLIAQIVYNGPFAQGPFLDDVLFACEAVVKD